MHPFRTLFTRYKSVLIYIFFGVITTAVNYLVYLPLYNDLSMPAFVSNIIAWFVAVGVAFLTNKAFVFQSNSWKRGVLIPELVRFYGLRAVSGIVETAIVCLTVDILNWNGNVWKLITSFLVIILNYVFGKFFVFHKKEKAPG